MTIDHSSTSTHASTIMHRHSCIEYHSSTIHRQSCIDMHCKAINGGYIRQVFVQHGHLRAMSSCSRAATRKQHTTFLNKYTSGWQWRSQGNLTQLQRRMHFPAECDMQVHRPGIFSSDPTRHVLDDGRLSHMQQT